MSEGKAPKRKNVYKHNNYNKKSKKGVLEERVSGFVVTCNLNEYQCLRESYNLLNEFADKLYGSDDQINSGVGDGQVDDTDVEKAIQNEINSMTTKEKRFQQMITNCRNVLFIKCNDSRVDPIAMASEILKEIQTNGKQLTRHLLRLIPIVVTFKTNCHNFDEIIESEVQKQTKESISFVIQCKVRNNSDIKRTETIDKVVNVVKKVRPDWRVDFTDPKITIQLDVLHKIYCLSFLNDYNTYCKYNLIEFSKKWSQRLNDTKTDENITLSVEDKQ